VSNQDFHIRRYFSMARRSGVLLDAYGGRLRYSLIVAAGLQIVGASLMGLVLTTNDGCPPVVAFSLRVLATYYPAFVSLIAVGALLLLIGVWLRSTELISIGAVLGPLMLALSIVFPPLMAQPCYTTAGPFYSRQLFAASIDGISFVLLGLLVEFATVWLGMRGGTKVVPIGRVADWEK
jgi:hypothetical protein